MRTNEMPKINMQALKDTLTSQEYALVERIVIARNGYTTLRASKPKVERTVPVASKYHSTPTMYPSEESGRAAYLWRMVAFLISPIPQHSCMPVMAFCDLPHREDWDERRGIEKEMDALADKVVDVVKPRDWNGVRRWAYAFGYADRPAGEL